LLTEVDLRALTTDTSRQLDILWHDRNTLGVNGAKIRIFEQSNEVGLRRFLQSSDGSSLETEISLVVLSDFSDQTLEWQLSDQQLSGLLVSSDFTESNSSRSESVWLLNTSSRLKSRFSKNELRIQEKIFRITHLAAFLEAWDLRGALPPVDLRAVCLVLAMMSITERVRATWLKFRAPTSG
jgi:hypothetical protein